MCDEYDTRRFSKNEGGERVVGPAARYCQETRLHVWRQHGVADARLARNARHHLRGVSHLGHPLRGDEGGGLDIAEPAGSEHLDKLHLASRRYHGFLVLQTIAGSDLQPQGWRMLTRWALGALPRCLAPQLF